MKRLLLSVAMVFGFGCGVAEAGGQYQSYYRSTYSGAYWPQAYVNGCYFTPQGYQPYKMSNTPTYGGASYQAGGSLMGWGMYSPYSFGGFAPGYGWGMYQQARRGGS